MTARLAGLKVLLTRSADDSADWAEAFADEGALPIVLPCIESALASEPGLGARIGAALANADWVVFTSKRGVDALTELVATRPPASARLAAVGDATAERLSERFGRCDLTGSGTAEALGAELAAEVHEGDRCVLALATNAGNVLERRLIAAGARVTRFDVYRTIPATPARRKRALSTLGADTVIFASPSAVTGFDNQVDVDIEAQMVTIGPSTSAAVRALDWPVAAEAKKPSLSGIIESLLETVHV
jgi:uroporphyrinogen III methyltransferase / synthase